MGNTRDRLAAVIETSLAFVLLALVFHAVRVWEIGRITTRPVAAYTVMILLCLVGFALSHRGAAAFGLSLRPLRYHLGIFGAAFLPVFLLSVSLAVIPWRTWSGALLVSVLTLGLTWLAGWMMRKQPALDLPRTALAVLLPLLMASTSQAATAFINLAYFYLLVAPAEEIFFRGYVLGRLDQAFGRPRSLLGIRWGSGLVISALLFGLWHAAANPLDISLYPQVLWTFFAGLLFGLVREKSASVAAPALLHGVLNYGPQAFLFDLFFKAIP